MNIHLYKIRAQFYQAIRQFFFQRQVIEVETPLLAYATVTSPYIDSFSTTWHNGAVIPPLLYLQTSPEYAMKRLLVENSGDIFQICKAFRDEGCGQYHNPEFTILEWYRLEKDLPTLMDEVKDLIIYLQENFKSNNISLTFQYFTYQELFLHYAQVDPFQATIEELQDCLLNNKIVHLPNFLSRDDWLNLIQTNIIEPQFLPNALIFIYDFPASQAALAQLNSQDSRTARRFECYLGNIELANGYDEETNPLELKKRFNQDNIVRQQLGKTKLALDHQFLHAMQQGLPPCIGVAMGLDRLLMWLLNYTSIKNILTFTTENT